MTNSEKDSNIDDKSDSEDWKSDEDLKEPVLEYYISGKDKDEDE